MSEKLGIDDGFGQLKQHIESNIEGPKPYEISNIGYAYDFATIALRLPKFESLSFSLSFLISLNQSKMSELQSRGGDIGKFEKTLNDLNILQQMGVTNITTFLVKKDTNLEAIKIVNTLGNKLAQHLYHRTRVDFPELAETLTKHENKADFLIFDRQMLENQAHDFILRLRSKNIHDLPTAAESNDRTYPNSSSE